MRTPHADRLPGLRRLARPADEGRRPDRGGSRHPRDRRPQGARRDRPRDARPRRHASRGRRPVPAPVQRRPAPAHRARARARPAAEARRRRRARLRARRLDPVAGAQPARGAEARVRPHLRVRRPRPRGRRLHLGSRRRDVPRPDRRDRTVGRALRPAVAPVHDGAPLGQPGAGAGTEEQPDRPHGRRAEPDRSAVGLPLPHTLPDRAADLRRGRPRPRGSRPRSPCRLPLPRDADHRLTARRLHELDLVATDPRRQAAPRPAGADARRHLALGRRLPAARGAGPADDHPVDAVRVDARALRRLGRLVREARLRGNRRRLPRPLRVRRRLHRLDLRRPGLLRHGHLGRRASSGRTAASAPGAGATAGSSSGSSRTCSTRTSSASRRA